MTDILHRLHCTIRCDIETAASGCHCAEARDEITRLRAENEAILAANRDVMLHWDVLKADYERLRAALTPSAETKAAYIGEFHFTEESYDEDGQVYYRKVAVPWTIIKEIMAAISARAALDSPPAPSESHLAPDHQAAMHGALRRSASVVQPAPGKEEA